MKKLTFVFVLLLVVLSCRERDVRNTLNIVESIVEEYPDSARTLLESIDKDLLTNKKDAADYSLYNAMIMLRSTLNTINDSLIMPAVEFYKKGPSDKKIRTLYYLSGLKIRAGESEEGLMLLEEARELAEEVGDYLYLGKCSHLTGIYYYTKEFYLDAEQSFKDALESYEKVGYKKANKNLYTLLGNLASRHSQDEAIELINKSIELCTQDNGDKKLLSANYWDLAYIYANKEEYYLAKKYAELALELRPALTVNNNCKYADLIYKTNTVHSKAVMDSVKYYVNQAFLLSNNIQDSCVVFRQSSKIKESEGNYKEAYEELRESFRKYKERLDSQQDVSPGIVQRKYYEAKARLEARKYYSAKMRNWGLGLAVFAIACCMVVLYRKNRRKNEEKIKYYETLAGDLSKQVSEQNHSLEDLKTKMRGIYKSQFQRMGDIVEALYLTRNNQEESNLRKRVSEVTAEFSTPESQRVLEERLNAEIDNIMVHIRGDFPNMKEKDYLFVAYMIIGFDATIVSIILDMTLNAVYSKKSRLKDRLFAADSPYREQYKRWIS